jgi:hypothetical protein
MFTQILLPELFPNLLAQKWSNKNMNDNLNKDFECIKCENKEFVEGKINTTGSGLSKFFNIQLHTFQTISCSECGYTDLFRREKSSFLSRLLQFFTN